MARKRIGEMLIQEGVLDHAGLVAALAEQRRWGGPLGHVLVDMQLVTEDVLVAALSRQLGVPTAELAGLSIPPEVLALVPDDLAQQHQLLPFRRSGDVLHVAMSDPTNRGVIEELRIRTHLDVHSHIAGPKVIAEALARWYDTSTPSEQSQAHFVQRDAYAIAPGGVDPEQREREREAEIQAMQARIARLEALVSRDEDVLRKLLGLLVDKGVASREEILERLR